MADLPDNVRAAYRDLADDPKYQHFVRIPDRIIQCMDYFGTTCDRNETRARLHAYYLFIGVVDDSIDSGRIDAGRSVLGYLSTPVPVFDDETSRSNVKLITEILKCHLSQTTYPLILDRMRTLYREVASERGATSISSYIAHRKSVGSLTAELSYMLIRPGLTEDKEKLCAFMQQVGAVGCLIDSVIDLSADRRLGLLGFNPGLMDYARLIKNILRDGLSISLKHPGLCALFLNSIIDNVGDRFRGAPNPPPLSIAADTKKEAASVA